MLKRTPLLLISTFVLELVVPAIPLPVPNDRAVLDQEYRLEAYHKDGDTHTLILRISPLKNESPSQTKNRQVRQEEEEEEGPSIPATNPFIPAIIPGITKIFQGIITGNLNDIFHGSTSFAPQNVSHVIDTVYNQVVGLPPPKRPTTQMPLVAETTTEVEPSTTAATPQPQAPPLPPQPTPPAPSRRPTRAPIRYSQPNFNSNSNSIAPGRPLGGLTLGGSSDSGSSSVVFTTPRRVYSNEDDEDEASQKGFQQVVS